jgi:hypothetical protein
LPAIGRHVGSISHPVPFRSLLPQRRLRRRLGLLALALAAGVLVLAVSAGYHASRFTQAVRNNDLVTAQQQIDGLRTDIRIARWAVLPLRPIGKIPIVGRPAADVTHAVDVAWFGVNAVSNGTEAYRIVESGHLIEDGRVNLELVEQLPTYTTPMNEDLIRSREALGQVRGGWAPHIGDVRDRGIHLLDEALPVTSMVDAVAKEAPSALGAGTARTYLVATLNSGELLPSGGALLAVAQVRVTDGRLEVISRGQVSELTDLNRTVPWTPLPEDPWQVGVDRQRLANANYSPDFPTSGEEILRLYHAHFGQEASGVITLDAAAFQTLLDITGPITSPAYGELTATNVVQKTMVDAYVTYHGRNETRHEANDNVIDSVFTALLQVRPNRDQAISLRDSIRAGHLQMYFREPGPQSVLNRAGLTGELAPFSDDVLGVYTINTNASKVDVFQDRRITQDVVLAADGSAQVTRSVVLTNDRTGSCPGGPGAPDSGYLSCVSKPRVILYVPQSATGVSIEVDSEGPIPYRGGAQEKGRRFISVRRNIDPGESVTLTVRYGLPASAHREGYALHWDAQPMFTTPVLTVRVTPAPGTSPTGTGWQRDGRSFVASVPMSGHGDLRLDL